MKTPAKTLIEIRGVILRCHSAKVTSALDFRVNEGDFLLIEGPNGSGKSFLLNLMGALEEPDCGDVILGTRSLLRMSQSERCAWRRNLGLVPADPVFLVPYTVRENLILSAQVAGFKAEEAKANADEVINLCGLAQAAESLPEELSEGMRKRAAIARALVSRPTLILADNPLEGLDEKARQNFLYLCTKLAQLGYAVVMATSSPLPLKIGALKRIVLEAP